MILYRIYSEVADSLPNQLLQYQPLSSRDRQTPDYNAPSHKHFEANSSHTIPMLRGISSLLTLEFLPDMPINHASDKEKHSHQI